jgi:hypothetical protein
VEKRVMRLTFCAACGVTDDLQHHHLVTRSEGDSDDERNLITLCDPCHAKLRERRSDGPTATDRLSEAAGIAGEAVGRLRAVWRHGEATARRRRFLSGSGASGSATWAWRAS